MSFSENQLVWRLRGPNGGRIELEESGSLVLIEICGLAEIFESDVDDGDLDRLMCAFAEGNLRAVRAYLGRRLISTRLEDDAGTLFLDDHLSLAGRMIERLPSFRTISGRI